MLIHTENLIGAPKTSRHQCLVHDKYMKCVVVTAVTRNLVLPSTGYGNYPDDAGSRFL